MVECGRELGRSVSVRLIFRRLCLVCAVGLALQLKNDRSLDQAVQESHRQRAV